MGMGSGIARETWREEWLSTLSLSWICRVTVWVITNPKPYNIIMISKIAHVSDLSVAKIESTKVRNARMKRISRIRRTDRRTRAIRTWVVGGIIDGGVLDTFQWGGHNMSQEKWQIEDAMSLDMGTSNKVVQGKAGVSFVQCACGHALDTQCRITHIPFPTLCLRVARINPKLCLFYLFVVFCYCHSALLSVAAKFLSCQKQWYEMGGMLFREYFFGEENLLSLTEFWGKLAELCEKELGEFAWSHK